MKPNSETQCPYCGVRIEAHTRTGAQICLRNISENWIVEEVVE